MVVLSYFPIPTIVQLMIYKTFWYGGWGGVTVIAIDAKPGYVQEEFSLNQALALALVGDSVCCVNLLVENTTLD